MTRVCFPKGPPAPTLELPVGPYKYSLTSTLQLCSHTILLTPGQPQGHAGLALSGGHRRVVALAICPPMGLEGRLLVSVCVSLVSGGISFSRHWVFGSQATLRVFPPICLVLVHGQGLHVSGGSAPTVLAAPCGAADESRFLTTAPLCSSVFLVKMCIFLFNKF